MRKARGEQQRCRFAQNAADGEDAACNYAVHAAGENDGADNAPLAGSEAERALAQALRNGFEALLSRAHNGRQVHDDKRHGAGLQGGLEAEEIAEKQHADKAVDDARNARESLGGVFDSADDAVVARIFREIYRSANAQRQHPHERSEDDIQRVEYIRQNADGVREVARLCREKLPRYIRNAPNEHICY